MDPMPFYLIFLQSMPDTIILIYLGLVLVGVDPPQFKRIFSTALFTGLVCYFVQKLMLPPGVNILIQLPFLILFLVLFCKLSVIASAIVSFIGLIFIVIFEALLDIIISSFIGISVQTALANPLLRILFPLPEFLIFSGCIVVFKYYRVILFDLNSLLESQKENKYEE